MSIKKGLAGLILGFGALSFANETYAQETPETPVIEQKKDDYGEFLHLYGEFIKHDKSLLPVLEEKLKEIKSKLQKNPPTDLSDKLFFLDGVERDLSSYRTQFSIYEETYKTLEEMLDKISEGNEIPGLYPRLSFIKRNKIDKITSPYLLATKQDLLNLIDGIYKAESDRKKGLSTTQISNGPKPKVISTKTNSKTPQEGLGNLVGYWSFDAKTFSRDGKFVADLSGQNNHGKLCGNPKIVKGVKGEALEFDGDDYIECGNRGSLKSDLPITIAFWVKLDNAPDHYTPILVSDNPNSGNAYYGYICAVRLYNTNIAQVSYGDGGSGAAQSRRTKKGTTVLEEGVWYHIVNVIKDATEMNVYINGKEDGGNNEGNGGPLKYSSNPFVIGKQQQFGPFYLKGTLDELTLFNRVLPESEVKAIYEKKE